MKVPEGQREELRRNVLDFFKNRPDRWHTSWDVYSYLKWARQLPIWEEDGGSSLQATTNHVRSILTTLVKEKYLQLNKGRKNKYKFAGAYSEPGKYLHVHYTAPTAPND